MQVPTATQASFCCFSVNTQDLNVNTGLWEPSPSPACLLQPFSLISYFISLKQVTIEKSIFPIFWHLDSMERLCYRPEPTGSLLQAPLADTWLPLIGSKMLEKLISVLQECICTWNLAMVDMDDINLYFFLLQKISNPLSRGMRVKHLLTRSSGIPIIHTVAKF